MIDDFARPRHIIRLEVGRRIGNFDFTIDLDSILTWDAPHDEIEIEVEELQKITTAIEEEFDKLGLVVEFE